jgi:TatD DNase family protein
VLTDTHCHLDFNRFDGDRAQVMARAKTEGLIRLLNPGITVESSKCAVNLAEEFGEVYAAVGVHPNDGLSWDGDSMPELLELAAHPKVVAIGEIGLDYYRDRTPRNLQIKILKAQLNLAAELDLPVVVHSREAMEDVQAILSEWQKHLENSHSRLADRPGVLHSFSGTESDAENIRRSNFLIGITGPVTFHNALDLQELVRRLPLDCILIETDSPFLTPHPYRGKRNEPARVRLVAEKIAELHQEAYNTVTQITAANAARLFRW